MKKNKKEQEQSPKEPVAARAATDKEPVKTREVLATTDELRVNLALGTLTLALTTLLLYILNTTIAKNNNPDILALINKVQPLSVWPEGSFFPEPVERMMFQLSLLCTPFFIFGSFFLLNKKKALLYQNPSLALYINIGGLLAFLFFAFIVLQENLLYVNFYVFANDPNVEQKTNTFFFANNILGKFNLLIGVVLYGALGYAYYMYAKSKDTPVKKIATAIVSYGLIAIVLVDLVMYDVFHLATQEWGRFMETNAVFYSITQVFAGKSLLVNINSQYGLFAWFLAPLFKIIGLSTSTFTMTMGVLNALAYFLVYLGVKRLLKQDLLSLIIFLALVFWHFWQTRIPFESTPRYYYQYSPIRFLFPALSFFLVVMYHTGTQSARKFLLPVLALVASFAIIWNLDTGLVVYGAVFVSLLFATLSETTLKDSLKQCVVYAAWMIGALLFVIALFAISTKIKSGSWPDFQHFSDFQTLFYISGFFMLPMAPVHFWNFVVIVYLIAGIYCTYYLTKKYHQDLPVIAFLFILGMGLFAYFQGRSFDLSVGWVMHPAIILIGIFSSKLLADVLSHKPRFHESLVMLFIPFMFLADGALSMVVSTPAIHSFASENASSNNPEKEKALKERMDFITNNLPKKDSVIILAKDFDSYYYAAGEYYNPADIPGSTEIFFHTEIRDLIATIKKAKYPVMCDVMHQWLGADSIMKTLAQYYTITKEIGPDHSFFMMKPRTQPAPHRLTADASTVYYNNLGAFSKYITPTQKLTLPENFTVEMLVTLDSSSLTAGNLCYANTSKTEPTSGLLMVQNGADLTQYMFTYGNGTVWCAGATCKLSCTTENHLVIKYQKNIITVYNNDVVCGTGNTNSALKNSDGVFFINANFAGRVNEIKISTQ